MFRPDPDMMNLLAHQLELLNQLRSAAQAANADGVRPNDYSKLHDLICGGGIVGNRHGIIRQRENIATQMIQKSPIMKDAKEFALENIRLGSIRDRAEERCCREIICSLTDSSPTFAEYVAESGYLELLLKELNFQQMAPANLNPAGSSDQKFAHNFAFTSLSILHNCLWRYTPSKNRVLGAGGLNIVMSLVRNAKSDAMKMEALMVLADLEDSNATVFETTRDILQFALNNLVPAIAAELMDQMNQFCVEELLRCLNVLAKNDNNAKNLVELGILDAIAKILETKSHGDDVKVITVAINVLRRFSTAFPSAMKSNTELIEGLRKLKASGNSEISDGAAALLLSVGANQEGIPGAPRPTMTTGEEPDFGTFLSQLLSQAGSSGNSSGTRSNDYVALDSWISSLMQGNKAESIKKRENIAQQMMLKSPVVKNAKELAEGNVNFKLVPHEIHIRNIIRNLTDSSPEFAKHVAESGYLELMVDELRLPGLRQAKLDPHGDIAQRMHYDFVFSAFWILDNCMWHYPETKNILRSAGGLEIILNHLSHAKSERMRMVIIMVLAKLSSLDSIPGDKEATDNVFKFILENALEPALEKEAKGELHRFSVERILHSLKCITQNDESAEQLVKLGIFDPMRKLLPPNEFGNDVTKICLRLLHQLSFTSAQALRENRLLLKQVKSLKDFQSIPAISESAFGVLLSVDEPINDQTACTPVSNQVMISYCSTEQQMAFKLRDALLKGGINVWIDANKTEGSVLNKMVEGVEGSRVVVILVSEAYSKCENCRSEATYAHRLGRHKLYTLAEGGYESCGWIEAMMGDELFYDIFARFDVMKGKLISKLNTLLV